MATLREIKRRIGSVKSTQQITRAMKMVAAAKLRKSQQQLALTRVYADELNRMLRSTMLEKEARLHSLFQPRRVKRVCYVLVTADRGLCGSFNSNLIHTADAELQKSLPKKPCLVTVGRKGFDHYRRLEYPLAGAYVDFLNRLTFGDAETIADKLIDRFLSGAADLVYIVYNEFHTLVHQRIVVKQFLPVVLPPPDDETRQSPLFEPKPVDLLNAFLPIALRHTMYRMLLESVTAEQAARMTAMDQASENAEEMIHDLVLFYNKARQASITKELSEIVGGAEALRQ